jgi:hypothetical protein
MAKLTLNESLERLAKEAERVEKLREELALKIGLLVQEKDESITNITSFREKYLDMLENDDLLKEFQEYIKAKKEAEKIEDENQNRGDTFRNNEH